MLTKCFLEKGKVTSMESGRTTFMIEMKNNLRGEKTNYKKEEFPKEKIPLRYV